MPVLVDIYVDVRDKKWSIVARDPGANNWRDLAWYAFWLGSPAVLDEEPSRWSKELKARARDFQQIGSNLSVLEHDLAECLNEFKTGYEVLYSAEHLALKKFSIVYHVDNFLVRVHKLRETVYRLLALMVGIHPDRRYMPKEPLHQRVEEALRRRKLERVLSVLRRVKERPIERAIAERNLPYTRGLSRLCLKRGPR
jgi:hypothetical protein